MKSYLLFLLAFGLLVERASPQDALDLTSRNQKINYALGMDIVSTFQQQDFDLDTKAFLAGMQDSLAGKPALTPDQEKAVIKTLGVYLEAKEWERRKTAAVENLKAGQDFLAANAKVEGVKIKEVTLPNGSRAELQYKILKSGSGPSPKKTDAVEVHYVGSRIDGSVFDSSIQRGTPATFLVTDVMPGWTEALQMMKAGDKWELFIPPSLAYGVNGPPQIGPNSTLIFQVELLSFYAPHPPSAAATSTPPATIK
jgi:FKBP-type peptidyl-prolyl cis-trans isomerase